MSSSDLAPTPTPTGNTRSTRPRSETEKALKHTHTQRGRTVTHLHKVSFRLPATTPAGPQDAWQIGLDLGPKSWRACRPSGLPLSSARLDSITDGLVHVGPLGTATNGQTGRCCSKGRRGVSTRSNIEQSGVCVYCVQTTDHTRPDHTGRPILLALNSHPDPLQDYLPSYTLSSPSPSSSSPTPIHLYTPTFIP